VSTLPLRATEKYCGQRFRLTFFLTTFLFASFCPDALFFAAFTFTPLRSSLASNASWPSTTLGCTNPLTCFHSSAVSLRFSC
jgi:hypothetical protein